MKTQAPDVKTEETSRSPRQQKPNVIIRWHRRVLGLCLVIFALELGLFLLIYPWRHEWSMSWIPVHSPSLFRLWMNRYFRGVISGLGLLNIYVALAELFKQLKSLLEEH